ncbi:spore coat protein U domain-containing protein [Brevundimonas diminuta]|uniref:Uncharacterized protein n=1 Tax=Brevundimonas diminuta TaxID=293 RepID=A0A1Z3LZD5_BREDI|nr:spore coat protein U domain-containing protein [Brevundimonas diminuta]ASD27570.1 hypothetical protein CD943_12115 [Brevundimonas diminuta]
MKAYQLIAGVAALALSATAASAGSFNQSASHIFGVSFAANNQAPAVAAQGANALSTFLGGEEVASWISASGSVANNIGTAGNAQASFTLRGEVSQDCSFYSGNINTVLNFGQIGINTLDNGGVDDAFDMVSAANASIETNTAGCNTRNEVRITKANGVAGMKSNYAGAFDGAQFQANLPYKVDATWTGVPAGAGSATASTQTLTVDTTEAGDLKVQGAWKSHFNVNINVPVPSRSLVSGTYQDTLTIELAAI